MSLFFKRAYVISKKYTGLVDLDLYPVRYLAENSGFLRGYTVCEVMEGLKEGVFREENHLNRLINSMIGINISFPKNFSGDELKKTIKRGIKEIISSNDITVPYLVKIYATGGVSDDGFFPDYDGGTIIWIFISRFVRKSQRSLILLAVNHIREMPAIKTTNYAFAVSVLGGGPYDDILYCDGEFVFETSTANIFFIKPCLGGILVKTPPVEQVLRGVSRGVVIELLKNDAKYNFRVEEKPVAVDELSSFFGVFVTSTTRFVTPVKRIIFKNSVPSCLYEPPVSGSAAAGAIINHLRIRFEQYRDIWYALARAVDKQTGQSI